MSKYSLESSPSTRDDPIAEAKRQWIAHGWEDAATGMAAVTTITRVNRLLVGRIEVALSPLGLTFARFEILRLLGFAREGTLPMGKIGDRLQVHPASVTSAVKRLERDGLISRSTASHDNRVVLARLLPSGQAVLATATRLVNDVFESLELPQEQLEDITMALAEIRTD